MAVYCSRQVHKQVSVEKGTYPMGEHHHAPAMGSYWPRNTPNTPSPRDQGWSAAKGENTIPHSHPTLRTRTGTQLVGMWATAKSYASLYQSHATRQNFRLPFNATAVDSCWRPPLA